MKDSHLKGAGPSLFSGIAGTGTVDIEWIILCSFSLNAQSHLWDIEKVYDCRRKGKTAIMSYPETVVLFRKVIALIPRNCAKIFSFSAAATNAPPYAIAWSDPNINNIGFLAVLRSPSVEIVEQLESEMNLGLTGATAVSRSLLY